MTQNKELVDIKFALMQLGGNSDLLNRMLNKFKDEFTTAPSEVSILLGNNNIKEAKLKVHTIKGLTGNLGLMALYECTKKLDQQIREENIEASQVELFSTLMADTCDFIASLNLADKEPPIFSDNVSPAKTNNKAVFLESLKKNEFIDDAMLHKYVDSLDISSELKHSLTELVEELQYSKAIEIINGLD